MSTLPLRNYRIRNNIGVHVVEAMGFEVSPNGVHFYRDIDLDGENSGYSFFASHPVFVEMGEVGAP